MPLSGKPSGPQLRDHEVIKWEHTSVDVQLSTKDACIASRKCRLTLTNQHIHISAPATTYRVEGKGDRTFAGTSIPLRLARPHRFVQPWFGPYKWETVVSGRLPLEPRNATWTLLLTFSDGGAFDYRQAFLQEYGAASQAAQQGMEETLPSYSEI